ncbi:MULTISPECIES: NAD-dependent epimerase [unclassified Hyphomonas]|uniref:NAD-dependent epimerase n=1 Tax=unclassified Hyphomonas TaxID=2630699 RepID=UPI000C476213|nr:MULTISPECIES: NAD-dependent epimerase [unclassified Hyphomonas]MAN91911.1 capsular biosynthesis protein CpsI [Hyphomonadaceae bacterium]RCL88614.1 MAG: NAD-dependent epimerase [Hyphomonas sp.]|tara:strand:+ start:35846 stop:36892 length:1047 start_codon:yes stop_codon:yes gene_type:complete
MPSATDSKTYLVTGSAGFIGFHVANTLLKRGVPVVGFDNLNAYYDPALKRARLKELENTSAKEGVSFNFVEGNLENAAELNACFESHDFHRVIHLAAQAGVRHSITHPEEYVSSNLVGFANMLEACRTAKTPHLVYASTSSAYGANTTSPYSESHGANHPLQLYSATKKANELMAHAYSHLYRLPTTGLRFFTVYGPWGRPDMALYLFTDAIVRGEPINIFNNGEMSRDFTYVDDIVEGVLRIAEKVAEPDPDWDASAPDPATSNAPYRIYNIGNNQPVKLLDYVEALENSLGRKATRNLMPMQPGDVKNTYADVTKLTEAVGYRPSTSVKDGVERFVAWYREYHGID